MVHGSVGMPARLLELVAEDRRRRAMAQPHRLQRHPRNRSSGLSNSHSSSASKPKDIFVNLIIPEKSCGGNLDPQMMQEDPCTAPCTAGTSVHMPSRRRRQRWQAVRTLSRTYSVHLFVRTPPSEKPPLWSSLTIQRPSPVIFMAI